MIVIEHQSNITESRYHPYICFPQIVEFRRVKYETSSDEEVVSTGEKWCAAFRARKEAKMIRFTFTLVYVKNMFIV